MTEINQGQFEILYGMEGLIVFGLICIILLWIFWVGKILDGVEKILAELAQLKREKIEHE